MRWILGLMAAVATTLAAATPVLAGGWATTLLDPLPASLKRSRRSHRAEQILTCSLYPCDCG